MGAERKRRTWWTVRHVELGVQARVAASSAEEAQSRAWREWYGRAPADELEWHMRDACPAEDTNMPADDAAPVGRG